MVLYIQGEQRCRGDCKADRGKVSCLTGVYVRRDCKMMTASMEGFTVKKRKWSNDDEQE